MKRKFYKLTVLCMLASVIFMSGCEGMDPIANFMKSANEAKANENEKEIALDNNRTQLQMQQNELDAAAAEAQRERDAEALKNITGEAGTIIPSTQTEGTANASVGSDQSNKPLAKTSTN